MPKDIELHIVIGKTIWDSDIAICIFSRAATIRPDYDTIWCTRFDMFRDTFAILSWEAEACDPRPAIRSTALHLLQPPAQWWCAMVTTMVAFSEFPDAVCLWWIYLLLDYTGCYLRYFMFVSNFGVTTVPYRIFLRVYHDMYHSLCIVGLLVYRFSPNI